VFAADCYRLGKGDIFAVPFAPISATTLSRLSDQHRHVRTIHVAATRPVSAYWDQGDSAQGVLIFFDGNGYGGEAALRRLLVPARALGLDLIAFNYYDQGQAQPSMAEMRRIGDALYDAARELPTSAAGRIYVGGHSLGAHAMLPLIGLVVELMASLPKRRIASALALAAPGFQDDAAPHRFSMSL
jgi:hypothetical protein